MTHEVDLRANVPSYGQQCCCCCGAASAQMAMNGYPDPLHRIWYAQIPPTTPNCWDTIQANNSTDSTDVAQQWCTDPRGLRECLQQLNPPPAGHWVVSTDSSQNTVLFNILYWMNKLRYPAPTLINQGGHWVVIVRFVSDVEPVGGSSPTLQEITYNDPEPHNVGSVITKTAAVWLANEWNGPVGFAGTWKNLYVAVIEPPVKGTVRVKKVERLGERIIEPSEAVKFAIKWIDELGLAKQPTFSVLGKKEIKNYAPILVREEIRPSKEKGKVPYYYIVPFGFEREMGACNVPLARIGLIVNAYTGSFEEVGAFGKPIRYLPEREAINIAARAMGLKDKEIQKMISEKMIKTAMMFQPSEITHIRIYPFWKVTIKEKTLYIDQLGIIYTTIKPCFPGD
jgi:hypothetical protein